MSFVSHNSCDLNTSSGKEGDKMNELVIILIIT